MFDLKYKAIPSALLWVSPKRKLHSSWREGDCACVGQQHWAELLAHVPSRNGTTFQNSKFLWEVEITVGNGSKPDKECECLVRLHVPSWCLIHLVTPRFMRHSLMRCVHPARLDCRCGQVWMMQIWPTVCCFQFVSVSACFLFADDTPQQKGHYKNLRGLFGSWFWRWKGKGLHLAMVFRGRTPRLADYHIPREREYRCVCPYISMCALSAQIILF